MIITDQFSLDENRRERLSTLSNEFPYVCLDVTLDRLTGRSWHWHDAFELDYIVSGKMILQTSRQVYQFSAGDGLFINARVLHDARAASLSEDCRLYAQLFYPVFLSGMYGSRIEQKYVQPMLDCSFLDVWPIRQENASDRPLLSGVLNLIRINTEDFYGSEFALRSGLGTFWCDLMKATEEYRQEQKQKRKNTSDTERLRDMIQFIRDHYMEEIRVPDIADSANVSLRECNRCFQRNIGTSPNAFLIDYRLRIAAGMIRKTDTDMMTICLECGFSSQSYFSKLFKTRFGLPPLSYRKYTNTEML